MVQMITFHFHKFGVKEKKVLVADATLNIHLEKILEKSQIIIFEDFGSAY